jgi:hypothetical protein
MKVLMPILLVAFAIVLSACSNGVVVTLWNKGDVTLTNVEIVAEGISHSVPVIDPGHRVEVRIMPQRESSLRLSLSDESTNRLECQLDVYLSPAIVGSVTVELDTSSTAICFATSVELQGVSL